MLTAVPSLKSSSFFFFFLKKVFQKVCCSQDQSGFLQSPASPCIILSLCPLCLPVLGGKAPTPHNSSYWFLLHLSFFECYTPESYPKSHTAPCRPHHPPGLPQTTATFPLCSTATCSQSAQPVKRSAEGGGKANKMAKWLLKNKNLSFWGWGLPHIDRSACPKASS